jgi:transposase-like protein
MRAKTRSNQLANNMGRNSNYSESCKREAVAKAEASGNISQTARELGISNKSLHAWIEVLKKPSGSSAKPRRTVRDDPAGASPPAA